MENVILIKVDDIKNYNNIKDKYILKDVISKRIYITNLSDEPNEIKTDKSNNWAKTFFYGGD